jgi:hypothetical protein
LTVQLLIVGTIVAVALAFIGRRAWRAVVASRAPKDGCGHDCGCGPT